MGFFDRLQKPGHTALKQEKHTTRTERRKDATGPKKPAFIHPIHAKPHKAPVRSSAPKKSAVDNNSRDRNSPKMNSPAKERGRNSRKRASSTPQRQEWGSDDDLSDNDLYDPRKRARRNSTLEVDPNRCIGSRKAFSDEDGGKFDMVHAADIATLSNPKNYKPAFPNDPECAEVFLQYPSASQKEKYELVIPVQNDDFKTLDDIREVMETIISNYLPTDAAAALTNDSTGLLRRVKRAVDRLAGSEYIELINEWNDTLDRHRQDGTIERVIKEWKAINLKLLERILTQTYARTVSLRVNELRRYENGTDNVYGELLPSFLSSILKKDAKMKSDQVFVDLGSGVGNCVLQAALEVGCESWGCEVMEKACDLAELQQNEFAARCRLWGLSVGDIHLERGDFLKNEFIRNVLQRADIVLVNNQAFTPALNEDLINLFLDLKDGAKVVSLKSFVPMGQKSQSKNAGAIYNILDVVQKTYYSKCVSWTDAPGSYFISTKDSSRVKTFA
ncbi:MAG: hypothetical protein Q9163_003557 [Psora crenata]